MNNVHGRVMREHLLVHKGKRAPFRLVQNLDGFLGSGGEGRGGEGEWEVGGWGDTETERQGRRVWRYGDKETFRQRHVDRHGDSDMETAIRRQRDT